MCEVQPSTRGLGGCDEQIGVCGSLPSRIPLLTFWPFSHPRFFPLTPQAHDSIAFGMDWGVLSGQSLLPSCPPPGAPLEETGKSGLTQSLPWSLYPQKEQDHETATGIHSGGGGSSRPSTRVHSHDLSCFSFSKSVKTRNSHSTRIRFQAPHSSLLTPSGH